MRRYTLDQLETFLTVLELKSFTAAGRKLNLSQPAISHHIRELEHRLGITLIDRVGKLALPTAAGRDFRISARHLLDEADRAEAEARKHRDGHIGTVRIGTANNVIVWILPAIIKRLRTQHPTLGLSLHSDWTGSIVERLLRDELDVGLVTLPVPPDAPLDVIEWRDEASYALFPASRSEIPDPVSPEMLANEDLILPRNYGAIRPLIDGWFAAGGITPQPVLELSNSEAIKSMVAAGVGVTVLPGEPGEHHGRGTLIARSLEPPLTRSLAIVTRRHRTPERALSLFLEALKSADETA